MERTLLNIELEGKAPEWIQYSRWYFKNSNDDQWAASYQDGLLKISGSDINWQTATLNREQIQNELDRLYGNPKNKVNKEEYPLSSWVLDNEEVFWVISVLVSAQLC